MAFITDLKKGCFSLGEIINKKKNYSKYTQNKKS